MKSFLMEDGNKFYIVNTIAFGAVTSQGSIASASMVLTNFTLIILVSAVKVLYLYILIPVCTQVRFCVQATPYCFWGAIILPKN